MTEGRAEATIADTVSDTSDAGGPEVMTDAPISRPRSSFSLAASPSCSPRCGAAPRTADSWTLLGALNAIVGVVLIRHPVGGVATLALLVGLAFIVNGATMVVLGVAIRAVTKRLAEPPRHPAVGGT
jgi:hypothetical protein